MPPSVNGKKAVCLIFVADKETLSSKLLIFVADKETLNSKLLIFVGDRKLSTPSYTAALYPR